MKKVLSLVIVLAMFVAFGTSFDSASAAARPSKVTGVTAAKTSCSITLKWKKAKRAKKYQVYQYQKSKRKYVRVKTTSKRSATIKDLKSQKTYRFRIRAISGKKKGHWSKVISVKTRKPLTHNKAVQPNSSLNVGDTYFIKLEDRDVKVKVTRNEKEDGLIKIEGTTEKGGVFKYNYNSKVRETIIKEPGYKDHFRCSDASEYCDLEGKSKKLRVRDKSTTACWSLDGIMPTITQETRSGYSKWCTLSKHISKYSASIQAYLKEQYHVKDGWHPYMHLADVLDKDRGDLYFWLTPHDPNVGNEWIRAYYNDNLIYEYHRVATK